MEPANFSVGRFGGKWGYKPVGKSGCRVLPGFMGEKHNRQAILYPWYDYLARLWIKSPEMCLMPCIKRQTANFSVESPVQICGAMRKDGWEAPSHEAIYSYIARDK